MEDYKGFILSLLKQMSLDNEDNDAILSFLRKKGYSIIDSIKAIRTIRGVDLNQAKHIVHFSKVWSDKYEINELFHSRLEEEFMTLVLHSKNNEIGELTIKDTKSPY